MLKDKSVTAKLAEILHNEGVAHHMSVLIGRAENGNFRGAWFVKVSDRTNIANTALDLAEWCDAEKMDFTHVNAKRGQFNLPPLDEDNLQEPDREPQRAFTDEEVAEIWKERKFPGEDEAQVRTA